MSVRETERLASWLEETGDDVAAYRRRVARLQDLVTAAFRASSEDRKPLFARIDEASSELGNPGDNEMAALVMEELADASHDIAFKRFAYSEAAERAGRYASWATSGGEGIARSAVYERLRRKLARLD